MNFGENLKKLRKSHGLSQEDLAAKINVSRQSVSKWETGDAYPEMNNLLELCKIFHCKINDLVNDSIIDIDRLDEETKVHVTTLKKDEQNKMKVLSKIISIIAKIGGIACLVAIPFVIAVMAITPYIVNNIDVKDGGIIWNSDNKKITIITENDEVLLKINDSIVAKEKVDIVSTKYIDVLTNNSKVLIIGYIEVGFLSVAATAFLISLVLKHLSKLFENLMIGETPFTLENVNHIKKMAWLMIAVIVISNVLGGIFELLLPGVVNMDFELFSLIEILFLFSLSYVFEYGRLIQLETKGRIYGE